MHTPTLNPDLTRHMVAKPWQAPPDEARLMVELRAGHVVCDASGTARYAGWVGKLPATTANALSKAGAAKVKRPRADAHRSKPNRPNPSRRRGA
jgi:hypothetical protein